MAGGWCKCYLVHLNLPAISSVTLCWFECTTEVIKIQDADDGDGDEDEDEEAKMEGERRFEVRLRVNNLP